MLRTFIIASFTRASLIRPSRNRFSTSALLDEPEQYHAIEEALLVVDSLNSGGLERNLLNMQSGSAWGVYRCRRREEEGVGGEKRRGGNRMLGDWVTPCLHTCLDDP